ncbi:MAG: glycosyltransferase [Planctomycetes bacterium]|nr:glycosyltransferase [Planctomycetota bacterium]
MRIALDYLPAVSHPPGVGRYARELVRALVRLPDRPELALCEFGRAQALYATHELGLAFGDRSTQRIERRHPRCVFELLARFGRGADVLAGGAEFVHQVRFPALPVTSARETIALAELPTPDSEEERALLLRVRRGAGVVVFARDAEARLRRRIELAHDQVLVASVGGEHWRRALSALPPPDAPARVLVLGRLGTGRAFEATLAALQLLRERGIDAELRLASGLPRPGARVPEGLRAAAAALAGSPAAPFVDAAPPAPDPRAVEAALPALVARSSVLLHLMRDAASAVTPLEALALGVPVVASRIPAFEEVLAQPARALRGAVTLVENERVEREPGILADALATAIARRTDAAAQDELQLGARPYTWEASAKAHLAFWRARADRA